MAQKRSKQTGNRQSSIPPEMIKPLASFMLTRMIDSPVSEQKEEIEKIHESVTPADMFNEVIKSLLQTMVDAEMDAHLGRARYARKPDEGSDQNGTITVQDDQIPAPKAGKNYRNGSYTRHMRSSNGDLELQMPRDRNGTFDSVVAPKGSRDITGIKEKILDLAAAGNSYADCARVIQQMLGVQISTEYVHQVVQAYQERMDTWRKRQLKSFYPFLFIDCLYVSMRDENGLVSKRAVYVVLGIDNEGHKELIHLYVGKGGEGKAEWMNIFSELHERGLQDILFVCVDGVTGVEEGVKLIYPDAHVQRCMVHMVRNSCQYISFRDRKAFCNDMKQIYQAHCLDDARAALDKLVANWDKQYHTAVNIWVRNFDTVVAPLFNYPACIRKVIYTTNAIESVNSSLRKVVKKGCYSSRESIMSIMLLRAEKVLSINWERRAVRNWAQIKSTLSVLPLTEQVMAKYAEAQ